MKTKEKQHSVPSNPNMMKKLPCVLVLIEHLSWHPACCTHITLKYSFIHTHWTQSRHPCWAARWAEPQSISIWARSPLLAVRRYWALVAHQWFEFRASCQPASMTAAVMKKKKKNHRLWETVACRSTVGGGAGDDTLLFFCEGGSDKEKDQTHWWELSPQSPLPQQHAANTETSAAEPAVCWVYGGWVGEHQTQVIRLHLNDSGMICVCDRGWAASPSFAQCV